MTLRGHQIANSTGTHVRAYFHNLSGKLVPNNAWGFDMHLRPLVPSVDVVVRSTHRGYFHLNQNLMRSRFGLFSNDPFDSRFGTKFGECLHNRFTAMYRSLTLYVLLA